MPAELAFPSEVRGGAAVIFDFDGLICDTETSAFESVQAIWTEHGLELTMASWSRWLGRRSMGGWVGDLEEALGRELDREAIRERRRLHHHGTCHERPTLPGVRERMAEARELGLAVGVASSSSREWVAGHLERLGLLGELDAVRGGDEVPECKPAPDVYLKVLDDLGADPARSLAFEDSPHGITAARAAGLTVVAVPNGVTRHLDLTAAHLTVDSLAATRLTTLLRDTLSDTPSEIVADPTDLRRDAPQFREPDDRP